MHINDLSVHIQYRMHILLLLQDTGYFKQNEYIPTAFYEEKKSARMKRIAHDVTHLLKPKIWYLTALISAANICTQDCQNLF